MAPLPSFSGETTPLVIDIGTAIEDNGNKETVDDTTTVTTETTASFEIHSSNLSWFRFFLFFGAAVLTGGVLPGQNVYSRLFCEAGLFRFTCDGDGGDDEAFGEPDEACCEAQWLLSANIMNLLTTLMTPLFLIGGLAFDAVGGQKTAIFGCALNALGFVVLAILLWTLQQTGGNGTDAATDDTGSILGPFLETAVFVVSIILIDLGMMTTNMAFMGFLWHLPNQQALVLSLSTSCSNIAALLPLVVRSILRTTGLSLQAILGFYVLSILLVATPICWWAIPSDDEFHRTAMEVLGIPLPRRKKARNAKQVGKILRAGLDILLCDKHLHFFTVVTTTLFMMGPFVYMTMADPMGTAIFDRDRDPDLIETDDINSGERLATIYNQWTAALGFIAGPIVGILVDRAPRPKEALWNMLWPICVATLVVAVCCPIPSWGIQTMNIVLVCTSQICVTLFISRYAILFAPPHRTGTVSGLLMCSLGVLGLVPLVAVTAYILVFSSYTVPTTFVCFLAAAVFVPYASYLRRNDPWPDSPLLLPEDELEVSKTFLVGTIEDAAFVAGISVERFRKLSSSSKVSYQRRLLDAAFTAEAADRVLEVAKRHQNPNRNPPMPENYSIPRLPIPDRFGRNATAGFEVVRGTAATSLEAFLLSFNGHGGFGGRPEPSVDFILSTSLNENPDDPLRLAVVESMFGPTLHCAEHYGTILEVRVPSTKAAADGGSSSGFEVAAVCCVYHPGGLEKGTSMLIGSDRYYFGIAAYGKPPIYLDREKCGSKLLQGFSKKGQWDELREEYERPMWYVNILGVHPGHQGKGYGRILLDVVATWAEGWDQGGSDCYLECSESNVAFYEKCGYRPISRDTVMLEGKDLPNYTMARRPQKF